MKPSSMMKREVLTASPVAPQLHLPDTNTVAQQAMTQALAYCADKMQLQNAEAALEALRQGSVPALLYAHYCLAARVSEAIAGLDPTIEGAFLYQFDATAEDLAFGGEAHGLPIHLIMLTERKTPALNSLVAALDRALTHQYAALIGPRSLESVLDVQVADPTDVARRIGVGALLTSIHNPPLRVWG